MGITRKDFGVVDGKPVDLYTLTNKNGMTVNIMTYGGAMVNILVPDRNGEFDDVILGFDDVEGYVGHDTYQGALIGRYCNRIYQGKFTLNGVDYQLPVNESNGINHLHGGHKGYDKRVWNVLYVADYAEPSLSLTLTDEDGMEGYPGTVEVNVIYTLTEDNSIKIEYYATTDKPTPVNLTNHSYFNLNGYHSGDILNHRAQLYTDKFTPFNEAFCPTGEIASVKGTPYDFTEPKSIYDAVKHTEDEQIRINLGVDNSFFYGRKGIMKHFATIYAPESGRILDCYSDQTAMQFYCGNYLKGTPGKNGSKLNYRNALCLETQYTPNSPNNDWLPSCILNPGEEYHFTTIYKFSHD